MDKTSKEANVPKPREVIESAFRSIKRRGLSGQEQEDYLLSLLEANIKKGMDIEARDDQGNTLLLLLARQGLLTGKIFTRLKDLGARINALDGEGWGIAHLVVDYCLSVMKRLAKNHTGFDFVEDTDEFKEVVPPVISLMETMAGAGIRFMSPALDVASPVLANVDRTTNSENDPPLLRLVRDAVCDFSELNLEGLLSAIVAGCEDINARDSEGRTLLFTASPSGSSLGLYRLSSPDTRGEKFKEKLDRVIELGLDINATDRDGNTLLMLMAKLKPTFGKFDTSGCLYFLARGADPYVRNAQGETLVSELLRLSQTHILELGFRLLLDYIRMRGVPGELFPMPSGMDPRKVSDFLNFFFNNPGNSYSNYSSTSMPNPRMSGTLNILSRAVYAILFASTLPGLQEEDRDYLVNDIISPIQLEALSEIADIARKQSLDEVFLKGFFNLFNMECYQEKLSLAKLGEFNLGADGAFPHFSSRLLSLLLQGLEADPNGAVKFIMNHLRGKLQELVSHGGPEAETFVSRLATVVKEATLREKSAGSGELGIDALSF